MPPATPLTAERITLTALTVMNEHGFHGVTIRRVAAALDVQPAALYRYIENKQELVDRMDEAMIAPDLTAVSTSGPDQAWDVWLASRARAFRRAFLRYRDGALLHATARPRPGAAAVVDAQRAALTDAGFTPDDAVAALFILTQFTVGAALERQQAEPPMQSFLDRTFEAGLQALLRGCTPPQPHRASPSTGA